MPEIPDGVDVCVIAGDIVAAIDKRIEMQQWRAFGHWLADLVNRGITPIGVAGNHDFLLQEHPRLARELPWLYLEDGGIEYLGVRFWGTPWTPFFCDWAFNAPEVDPGEEFLHSKFRKIPTGIDVLIAHGPPAGFHDLVGSKHVGSIALNVHVQRVMPTLTVYGHIHHGYGVEHIGDVTLANVSHTAVKGGGYVPANQPVIFEI